MNTFVTIRSFLLVLTLYVSFIINNSFSQFFQSEFALSSFVLCFILAELFSIAYKFIFSHTPGFQIYLVNLLLAFLLLLNFPFLLNYFIIFLSLLVYFITINFLSSIFNVEDFSNIIWSSTTTTNLNANYNLSEKKGLFYSYYSLILHIPLTFVSLDDKRSYFDLIRNNEAFFSYADSHEYYFSFTARGCKFFPTTRYRLLSLAFDIEKMNNNFTNL